MQKTNLERRARALLAVTIAALATGCADAQMEAKSPAPTGASPAADAPPPAPPPPPPPVVTVSNADGREPTGEFGYPPGGADRQAKQAPKEEHAPAKKPAATPPSTTAPNGKPPTTDAVQKQAPIIIYSAQLTMAVFEVENGLKRIEALGKEMGGFLAKREDTSIVIRVPADRFDETVRAVEKLGDMLHRNVTAEDVTEEYRDLDIRLKASKAVQDRLTQLLQKAQKVEESIAIERELDRVTMEIDRIEGRMKFLRDRAAFSTITVVFQPKAQENVSQNPFKMPTPWLSQLGLSRLFQL